MRTEHGSAGTPVLLPTVHRLLAAFVLASLTASSGYGRPPEPGLDAKPDAKPDAQSPRTEPPAAAAPVAGKTEIITLNGQVVCSVCWFEADRKVVPYGNDADLECWDRCAMEGIPTALAVTSGNETTLYLLEKGELRQDSRGWRSFVGKMVEATGRIASKDGKPVLRVDAMEVLAPGPASDPIHPPEPPGAPSGN